MAAAAPRAAVEIVGRVGDDPDGDALMIALARAGVGHVAVLRDPARRRRSCRRAAVPDDERGGRRRAAVARAGRPSAAIRP